MAPAPLRRSGGGKGRDLHLHHFDMRQKEEEKEERCCPRGVEIVEAEGKRENLPYALLLEREKEGLICLNSTPLSATNMALEGGGKEGPALFYH